MLCDQRYRIGNAIIELTKPRQPCRTLDVYGNGIRKAILASPGLAGFYDWIEPYTYPLMRFIIGMTVFPFGFGKIMNGMTPVIGST